MRTFDKRIFQEMGINYDWVQENHSYTVKKGIIRGLHFQQPPYAETKLVRCSRGSIFDVFVDLRKGSPTFGEWDGLELSAEKGNMLLIPRGFAHGFCTLENFCDVFYKVDNYYSPDHEGGILWDDSNLAIKWPGDNHVLSEKDKNNMTLAKFIDKIGGLDI